MSTNYASFIKRVNETDTKEKLKSLEVSLDRLYSAGIFTVSEFKRLDSKILTKLTGV